MLAQHCLCSCQGTPECHGRVRCFQRSREVLHPFYGSFFDL